MLHQSSDSPYARGRTNSFMIVTSERGTVPEVDLDDEASAIVRVFTRSGFRASQADETVEEKKGRVQRCG